MDPLPALSRRSFVRLGASAAALSSIVGLGDHARAAEPGSGGRGGDPWRGLKMGIASYSLSKLPLEAAIAAIRQVDIHYVSIKDAHLPLKSSTERRKEVARMFRDAGITPLSCGNITM